MATLFVWFLKNCKNTVLQLEHTHTRIPIKKHTEKYLFKSDAYGVTMALIGAWPRGCTFSGSFHFCSGRTCRIFAGTSGAPCQFLPRRTKNLIITHTKRKFFNNYLISFFVHCYLTIIFKYTLTWSTCQSNCVCNINI